MSPPPLDYATIRDREAKELKFEPATSSFAVQRIHKSATTTALKKRRGKIKRHYVVLPSKQILLTPFFFFHPTRGEEMRTGRRGVSDIETSSDWFSHLVSASRRGDGRR